MSHTQVLSGFQMSEIGRRKDSSDILMLSHFKSSVVFFLLQALNGKMIGIHLSNDLSKIQYFFGPYMQILSVF